MSESGVSLSGADLLRALGGGGESIRARPSGAQAGSASGAGGTGGVGRVEGMSFQDLLAKARSGEMHSGLSVTAARGSGLELREDQLQRLSAAADLAEAAGATRALVEIDGMSLLLDVGVRQVTAAPAVKPGQVLTGIDAVIELPSAGGAGGSVTSVGSAAATAGLDRLARGAGLLRRE